MEDATHADLPSPGTPAPSEPASVIRTFLIADIRGYTSYSDARGDEAAAELVERFVSIARERVELHAGAIAEVRGDEVLAVFDSARQAVRAAVDLQAALAAEQTAEAPLGVGIGIDAGEAVPLDGGYRGRSLNLAGSPVRAGETGGDPRDARAGAPVRAPRGDPVRGPGTGPAQGDLEADHPDERRAAPGSRGGAARHGPVHRAARLPPPRPRRGSSRRSSCGAGSR